jgi:hypothetical protein
LLARLQGRTACIAVVAMFYSPTLQHIYLPVLYLHRQITNELNLQMGAYDIEDAMTWKKKIELIIDLV